MKISRLYEASNDDFKLYCPGARRTVERTGNIPVNNPPGTAHLSLFVAFLLSTMTDQLVPVIFVS